MLNQHNYSEYSADLDSQVAQELVQLLMQPQDSTYPWNPLAAESEAYLVELEQAFSLEDWSAEEISRCDRSFFNQLDQLRSQYVPGLPVHHLQAALAGKFATRAPQAWLEAIAAKASELVGGNLSLPDRLVYCVQQLLPNWAEDDLEVLARPLAFAMRGVEAQAIDLTLGNIRSIDWQELSELEQARLSLAIARYAIAQLEATDE
jgi:hypothetical protein